MARIRVTHDIDDLANDCASIAVRAKADMVRVVRRNAVRGNRLAKSSARRTAGEHGVHYPDAFSWEMRLGAFGGISAEYGPDKSKKQGGMSFEWGSRNQSRPHLNLNNSADKIGPEFRRDVSAMAGGWFW